MKATTVLLKIAIPFFCSLSFMACKSRTSEKAASTETTTVETVAEEGDIYKLVTTAIDNNDAETFDRLIKQVPAIDSLMPEEDGIGFTYTLLGYAVNHNSYDFVEKLIDLKANMDCGFAHREFGLEGSVLHVALRRGFESMLKLLLEKGADPNYYCRVDGNSSHNSHEPYLGKLFRKDGKYYFKGPVTGNEAIYDKDVEMKKTTSIVSGINHCS